MTQSHRAPQPYSIRYVNGEPIFTSAAETPATPKSAKSEGFLIRSAERFGVLVGRTINAVDSVKETLREKCSARGIASAMLGTATIAGAVIAAKNGIEASTTGAFSRNAVEAGAPAALALLSSLGLLALHANTPYEPQAEDSGLNIFA